MLPEFLYDKDTKKQQEEIKDTADNNTYTFNSKIVFVCASSLNSTWLLMNSATDIWPDGLGSSSGELGHNVMDHHYNLGASGKSKVLMTSTLTDDVLMDSISRDL
ncbi:MAG: hypothetical protein IPL55_09675 [Saprospiraceae bacterium]|nr:hypothetical protein [Saprospiraceae bacterium]